MDQEMFSYFPEGIRAMLVDDDRFVRSSSALLHTMHFKVSTCPSPSEGMRFLRHRVFDVVLCDTRKVATCGFDFRSIVETELRIPVIYLFATEAQPAADELDDVLRVLQTATFIVEKPLAAAEVAQLWRVVASRKFYLRTRRPDGSFRGMHGPAAGAAGGQGGQMMPGIGDEDESGVDEDEERVHNKVVGSDGWKRKQCGGGSNNNNGYGEADSHPTKVMERKDVQGPSRKHVALQREQMQKLRERRLPQDGQEPQGFVFKLKPIAPQYNPLFFAGGAGPSNAAAAPPPYQHPTGNVTVHNTAPAEEGQQLSAGGQASFPQLFFGPFAYQGPPPPVMQNMLPVQATTLGDLLIGATAAAAGAVIGDASAAGTYAGAAPSEAAMEAPLFNSSELLVAPQEQVGIVVAVAPEDQNMVASMVGSAELFVAGNNDAPQIMASDVQAPALAPAADDQAFVFPLEALMGLDLPMGVEGAAAAANGVAGSSLELEEDAGMGFNWDLGTESFSLLDDIFKKTK